MLVALQEKSEIPRIGEVIWIQPNPTQESTITILLYEQEKCTHKPKWLRNFKKTARDHQAKVANVILYDFQLTSKGAIRKSTREFLKTIIQ